MSNRCYKNKNMRNPKKLPAVVRLSRDVAPTVVKASEDASRSIAEEIRLRLTHSYQVLTEDELLAWNAKRRKNFTSPK